MDESTRLDRQTRIEGWNQAALSDSKIAVCADTGLLASEYILSASALGINSIVAIAPSLDEKLIETAKSVNQKLELAHVEGCYVSPLMNDYFSGCKAVLDLTHYGLANKLLINFGFESGIPIIRGNVAENELSVFTYMKGREWSELEKVVCAKQLPHKSISDPVLGIIAAGILLEETKNCLMAGKASEDIITYRSENTKTANADAKILVVGAGALGNFAGLGLALSGYKNITLIDPDTADSTNLNRQVFLYDGIGESKAVTLSKRLNEFFGAKAKAQVCYFRKDTDLSGYDAVFDCVDNFETRIVLSEKCKEDCKVLVSGGTNIGAGQAVVYVPAKTDKTPAEFLGLYEIVGQRKKDEEYVRQRASCTYRPNPSVIMTNQIIGGLMVDLYRQLSAGIDISNIFYDSNSSRRM